MDHGHCRNGGAHFYERGAAMRKLMWFSIGFGAACAFCAYSYVDFLYLMPLLVGLFCALFRAISSRIRNFRIPAMVCFGLAVGFLWFCIYDAGYVGKARNMDGITSQTTITASDYSYTTEYGAAVDGKVTIDNATFSVRVYLNDDVNLKPGDVLNGEFRHRFTSYGGMQEPNYLRSEGIYLILYPSGEVEVTESTKIPNSYMPACWRMGLLDLLDRCFPDDVSGFAKALILGDRTGIDYETNTAFKLSGISHIIAVSGLHVSILFGLIYAMTGRKGYLTGIVGIPVLLVFAAIAGFTPSITRACLMQILVLAAMMTNREYDPPTSLAFAVLCMLAVNPMTVISVSFQLSVGCMAGIFLLSGRIKAWFEKRFGSPEGNGIMPKLKRWFISSVSVSIASSILTTPLVAWYFGCVSLVSILTNLMTLWVVTYIFYGILLACIVGQGSVAVATGLAAVIAWPIRYVVTTAKLLASFPLCAVYTENVYITIWLIGCYCLLAVYMCMKEKPLLVLWSCAVISLCFSLMASWVEPLTDDYRMTVLDVGQGQCILLQSEGRTYMVDCGGDSATETADIAAEHLLSRGIFRLDGIILTHYDEDHAGGLEYFLTRVKTDALFLPDIVDEEGIGTHLSELSDTGIYVSDDLLLSYGDTKLTILGPEMPSNGNESSLCVLFQRENCDILITGDRGALGEMLLLNRTELPELEVLVAGHHGSAGSTGDALLAATTPETVMISVGAGNRYGHPAQSLLERLAYYGCAVYRTDQHGTIIYRG